MNICHHKAEELSKKYWILCITGNSIDGQCKTKNQKLL